VVRYWGPAPSPVALLCREDICLCQHHRHNSLYKLLSLTLCSCPVPGMLKFKNVNAVLAQSVQQQDTNGTTIISSILITPTGRPVAAYHHSSRVPPDPLNISFDGTADHDRQVETPYHVDRSMRTKVYGLLASTTWDEYSRGSILPWRESKTDSDSGSKSDLRYKWISVLTEDTLLVIRPIQLHTKEEYLLSILVTDSTSALGIVCKKSEELVGILEVGLKEYKLYD
jgi:hypothetical protein